MITSEEQLDYIYRLIYIYVNNKEKYDRLNKNIKSLYLMCNFNINKLQNTLIKISCYYNNYLNNLPLNLKYLSCKNNNCNLPPKLLYLVCYWCDSHNLPKSLQFINIADKPNKPKIAIELIYYYDDNINFIYFYHFIIKLKSIY